MSYLARPAQFESTPSTSYRITIKATNREEMPQSPPSPATYQAAVQQSGTGVFAQTGSMGVSSKWWKISSVVVSDVECRRY